MSNPDVPHTTTKLVKPPQDEPAPPSAVEPLPAAKAAKGAAKRAREEAKNDEGETGSEAGHAGSRAKKERIEPTWTDADTAKAKATLLRNLNATKKFFDKEAKEYVIVPDPMAQIAAAVAICNQAIGLPIQRRITIDANFKDRTAELLELARTPSGRDMLLRMGAIDEEWLAKHLPSESQQAGDSQLFDKSQVVDVQ